MLPFYLTFLQVYYRGILRSPAAHLPAPACTPPRFRGLRYRVEAEASERSKSGNLFTGFCPVHEPVEIDGRCGGRLDRAFNSGTNSLFPGWFHHTRRAGISAHPGILQCRGVGMALPRAFRFRQCFLCYFLFRKESRHTVCKPLDIVDSTQYAHPSSPHFH